MVASNRENQRSKWIRFIPAILLLILAGFFAFNFDLDALRKFLDAYQQLGLVICLGVYLLLGLTLVPAEPVTLLILAWQGPWVALLMATLGNTLSGMVEFFIGGSLGDLADFETRKEKLPFRLGRLPMNSPLFLLLARMLPGFGSKFVSVAGGAFKVPFITYLWTTVAANLVGAAFVVGGGEGLLKLFGR